MAGDGRSRRPSSARSGPVDVDGTHVLRPYGPDLTHFGSRATLAAAALTNTDEHLAEWIDKPSAMKPMKPQRNDLEIGRILGMPSYGLASTQIAELVEMLEGWE